MKNTDNLKIKLPQHEYPIIFGENILRSAGEILADFLPSKLVIIITDENVGKLYLQSLQNSLISAEFKVEAMVIPAGESSKSFEQYQNLCEKILQTQPDRATAIIALGGGVVGDLAGFVAATLLRGLPFVQVPTTLLAQVDSSVGGKVAINALAGKNLVGAFYQPNIVLTDLITLATLSPAELLSGYGEIIKYGLLGDADFYAKLLASGGVFELTKNPDELREVVKHCCAMKAEIVAADEREQGKRAYLNLGHTFAHAIEKAAGYDDTVPHGQAVALGCLMAMRLSQLLGFAISATETSDLQKHFSQMNMPVALRDFATPNQAWNACELTNYCYGDKKASSGKLNFVVLEKIGLAKVQKNVAEDLVIKIFEEFL